MSEIDLGEKFALGSEEEQQIWQRSYRGLVEALRDPSHGEQTPYVGRSIPRNDVLYKVRGKAKYAANLTMPGMLLGKFVRSSHPYASVKRVEVTKARALPGVLSVLTAADFPGDRLLIGSLINDQPVLAKDVVRHVGEPIVAIAAETREIAEAAASLVEIDYEPLTPILSPRDALSETAVKLHEGGNVIANMEKVCGDVAAAFAAADIVVEGEYRNEPRCRRGVGWK
ncbi:MAG: hypothetical protein K2Z80_32205 [Xanthobacteraceae bacterium]|nr:hypothetical protein [Xanthobacteraceae bacterium]